MERVTDVVKDGLHLLPHTVLHHCSHEYHSPAQHPASLLYQLIQPLSVLISHTAYTINSSIKDDTGNDCLIEHRQHFTRQFLLLQYTEYFWMLQESSYI